MTNVVLALTTHVLVQHLIAVTHTTLCVVQLTVFVLYLRAPFMPLFEVKACHCLYAVACCLLFGCMLPQSFHTSFQFFFGGYELEVEVAVEVAVELEVELEVEVAVEL